jgi:hypothetical protein
MVIHLYFQQLQVQVVVVEVLTVPLLEVVYLAVQGEEVLMERVVQLEEMELLIKVLLEELVHQQHQIIFKEEVGVLEKQVIQMVQDLVVMV